MTIPLLECKLNYDTWNYLTRESMIRFRHVLHFLVSVLISIWITTFYVVPNFMTPERKLPDPSSFSDTSKFRTTHLHLSLKADLKSAILSGSVKISFERLQNQGEDVLVLDSEDLDVSHVIDGTSKETLGFSVGEKYKTFGSPLKIQLNSGTNVIEVFYKTSPEASGVQVLEPGQTMGKKHHYLFTQNQAIHARSMVPCQDTPGVKATYSADITVDKYLTAVMSADKSTINETDHERIFHFQQSMPIPSYLIALVIGDIVSKDISERVKVWSEPGKDNENIMACEYEFKETDDILSMAENIAGEYRWHKYDLVVLPPSFPYGGMENPCMTFVTPTLLAGDRSLVNVVAHEIAHSWTGNLVTNSNWENFWLNEGFTVFLERKIQAKMAEAKSTEAGIGEKTRNFAAMNGWISLKNAVKLFGADSPLTALNIDLTDVDPDDAFSAIPYEKGFAFLFYLESLVGGAKEFDPFLRQYIKDNAGLSISSDVFTNFYKERFPEVAGKVDWDTWLNKPGIPPVKPDYDESLSKDCNAVIEKWNAGDVASDDIDKLNTEQVIWTLSNLLDIENFAFTTYQKINEMFNFAASKNSEIKFRWCRLGIKLRDQGIVKGALSFVTTQGRMKFVRPIYRDLMDWPENRQLTRNTFDQNKKFYHNICRMMVERDMQKYDNTNQV